MPRRYQPVDPLSPLEPERDIDKLRKAPTHEMFLYAFSDSAYSRNQRRRRAQTAATPNPESQGGGSDA